MSAGGPLRVVRSEPPALEGRAADDLRFIRETMEGAGTFTAVPGRGGLAMGAVACATAAVASTRDDPGAWLAVWLAGACVAASVGAVALARKARAAGSPVLRGVGAKFVRSLSPPLAAGAVLTVVLWRAGLAGALPGTWLLLYGTGLVTAGAFSVRILPAMGLCFMAAGAAALLGPRVCGDLWMALGFGGLHAAFGLLVWRRHGG